MTVDFYEKHFNEGKILVYFLILSFIVSSCLFFFTEVPFNACLFMFLVGGISLSIFASIISLHIYDNLVEKQKEYDRKYTLPNIKLRYTDFDDKCSWTRVYRNKRYGNYDENTDEDVNLMNRKGQYLLTEWCKHLIEYEIPSVEGTGNEDVRFYKLYYKDGGQNLIYCHGVNKSRAEIVFDEPVQEIGDVSNEYIRVVFMDDSVNYVKLIGGNDIMFEENLPGGYKRIKN